MRGGLGIPGGSPEDVPKGRGVRETLWRPQGQRLRSREKVVLDQDQGRNMLQVVIISLMITKECEARAY